MSEQQPLPSTPLRVRRVHPLRAWIWLVRGWNDFMAAPWVGLAHGLATSVFGAALLWFAWDHFWVLAGAFSGFMMVGPLLATGLYAVSRALQRGEAAGFGTVWAIWRSLDRRLVQFGLLLMFLGTGWVVTSAALISLGARPAVTTPMDFLVRVVLAPQPGLFEVWLLVGALMAAPVFASSVIAIPLLMDRQVGVKRAVLTSWKAVLANPVATGLWAGVVLTLTLAGLLTCMFGLVFVMPVLGHASWHAYRDLVVREKV